MIVNIHTAKPRSVLITMAVLMGLVLFATGCTISTGTKTNSNSGTNDSPLEKATFAKRLSQNQEPVEPTDTFAATDTIYLSLQFKGRPKGKVTTKFYFRDDVLGEATLDLADINSGVIFSIGQSTYAGFNLTPNNPFPIGEAFRAESFFDGKPLGSFKFKIAAPEGAIQSRISNLTLAHGVDADNAPVQMATTFATTDKVFLVGTGDFGLRTWIEANWYVGGKLADEATRSFTMNENKPATPFYFNYEPASGWPRGTHEVVLLMNGVEAGRLSFTVQ